VLFAEYLVGQVKEDELYETCRKHGEVRHANIILIGIFEGPLRESRHRYDDNIKIYFNKSEVRV
jgi:hypothetical protein